jgi:hypothetical protein
MSIYIVQYKLLCSLTIVYCAASYMFRPIHMAIFRLLREKKNYSSHRSLKMAMWVCRNM